MLGICSDTVMHVFISCPANCRIIVVCNRKLHWNGDFCVYFITTEHSGRGYNFWTITGDVPGSNLGVDSYPDYSWISFDWSNVWGRAAA
jgi:hypothetical protein